MMRQGPVGEVVADMNLPPASLPPLNNLPQWSRINTLDKARYPKPFLKDRLQPLPHPEGGEGRQGSADSGSDRDLEETDAMSSPNVRIQHLEKSIHFLRHQHQEILASLHDEIDKLKRDNKELQFRLVMIAKSPTSPGPRMSGSGRRKHEGKAPSTASATKTNRELSAASKRSAAAPPGAHEENVDHPQSEQQSQVSDEKLEELKIIFLEEEIKELKKTLREEKNKNHQLTQLLERAEQQYAQMIQRQKELQQDERTVKPASAGPHQHASPLAPLGGTDPLEGREGQDPRVMSAISPAHLPYNATLDPLTVRPEGSVSTEGREPTVKECAVIIKHLQQVNDKQAHELNQLKSDLRDVLYSHKWTPDAYLLAKAYIAEDDARETAEQGKLPKIPMKQPTRKLPDIAYIQKDTVSLPALKQTMGNKAIERRKRTQILQKARLRREITGGNEGNDGF